MATLIEADRVKYMCSCGRHQPLAYLYYCKYCKPLTLKCRECVLHEIDQKYFCTNCFDNKVQKEVLALKYKCFACYSCPCCKNILITRASSYKPAAAVAGAQPQAPSETSEQPQQASTSPQQPQKVYYLMCGFCHWTTRESGIPDAFITPGGWKLQENPRAGRIVELIEGYKLIAAKEKAERERKKYPLMKRRNYNLLASELINYANTSSSTPTIGSLLHTDKFGLLTPVQRRLQLGGGSENSSPVAQQQQQQVQSVEEQFKSRVSPSQTVDSFDPLPDEFYKSDVNVNSITTISQRHSNPEFQPARSRDLYPLNKFYHSKESKRCMSCEHNVLKPESNITSIKFKLHQMAIFIVPEVRIVSCTPSLKLNQTSDVVLSVINRSENDVTVSFVSVSLNELKTESEFDMNGELEFAKSNCQIVIDRADNTRQSSSSPPSKSSSDLDELVCFRRENKIGVKCRVTPRRQAHRVRCSFDLKCILNIKESTSIQVMSPPTTTTTTSPAVSSPSGQSTTPSIPPTSALSPTMSSQTTVVSIPMVYRVSIDLGPLV